MQGDSHSPLLFNLAFEESHQNQIRTFDVGVHLNGSYKPLADADINLTAEHLNTFEGLLQRWTCTTTKIGLKNIGSTAHFSVISGIWMLRSNTTHCQC